jgi:hypothetical protein
VEIRAVTYSGEDKTLANSNKVSEFINLRSSDSRIHKIFSKFLILSLQNLVLRAIIIGTVIGDPRKC